MKNQLLVLFLLVNISMFSQGTKTAKTSVKQTTSQDVAPDAIKYSENNKVDEITVDGKDILVSGDENKLTFKGVVGKIVITGKNNDILIESVKQIIVPGSGNFVSWEKSTNVKGKPEVQDIGGYNNIEIRTSDAMERLGN